MKPLILTAGLVLLTGSCAGQAHDRLHIVKWQVSHYDSTMRNGSDVGPSLAATAFVLDIDRGSLAACNTTVDLKALDRWNGSPLSCKAMGSGKQAGAPDHRYSITEGGGKPAEDFPFVQYFRLDQTARTLSFCFVGSDFTSCSAETPIPP